jgi:hypothetical protein
MASQFVFKDARGYVHPSDILPFVLERTAVHAPSRVVVSLHKFTTTQVEWVRSGGSVAPQGAANFSANVTCGEQSDTWLACPLPDQAVDSRVPSRGSVIHQAYSAQGFEIVSGATDVAGLVMDLITCMKSHWQQFDRRDGTPVTRRLDVKVPLPVPTGLTVLGRCQARPLSQTWTFRAPEMPGFELAIVAMLLTKRLDRA